MNKFERESWPPPLSGKNLCAGPSPAKSVGWGLDQEAQVISFWLLKETPGCLEVSGDLGGKIQDGKDWFQGTMRAEDQRVWEAPAGLRARESP